MSGVDPEPTARRGGINRRHMDGAGLDSEHPPVLAGLGRACAAAAEGRANPASLLLCPSLDPDVAQPAAAWGRRKTAHLEAG